MSADDDQRSFPQSMRHKQILEVAAEHPEASVEEVASKVPSATPELVERVFEKHGDPAADDDDGADSVDEPGQTEAPGGSPDPDEAERSESETEAPESPADADGSGDADDAGSTDDSPRQSDANDGEESSDELPTPAMLSDRQHEVLAIVAERPAATQQEIGDELGVSSPTVSNRVNSIEGFDWSERESFVEGLFDESPTAAVTTDGGPTVDSASTGQSESTDTGKSESAPLDEEQDGTDSTARIEDELARINDRLAALEAADEQDSPTESTATDSVFADPALVHKVAHACLDSDAISEAEELRILEALLE